MESVTPMLKMSKGYLTAIRYITAKTWRGVGRIQQILQPGKNFCRQGDFFPQPFHNVVFLLTSKKMLSRWLQIKLTVLFQLTISTTRKNFKWLYCKSLPGQNDKTGCSDFNYHCSMNNHCKYEDFFFSSESLPFSTWGLTEGIRKQPNPETNDPTTLRIHK